MRTGRKQRLRTYDATMIVTRAEEWCVEASNPDEAKQLLASGHGDRCHLGGIVQIELERMLDHT
jgi:hypothetical protein